jgi:hypothetical protein
MAGPAASRATDFDFNTRNIMRSFCARPKPAAEAACESSIYLFLYRKEGARKGRDNYIRGITAKS